MSKRKNRSKAPNLPQSTLERARQQAEDQTTAVEPAAPEPVASTSAVHHAPESAPLSTPSAPRPQVSAARREEPKGKRAPAVRRRSDAGDPIEYRARKKELDSDGIARLLAHPTKVVTEAELRERYRYVLNDLRSMAVLAAILVVVLVAAARFL
jgi:hypothetical protein